MSSMCSVPSKKSRLLAFARGAVDSTHGAALQQALMGKNVSA